HGHAPNSLPLGGIVGVGELADCVTLRDLAGDAEQSDLLVATQREQDALRFERMPRPKRPIPAAGRGMLWTVAGAAKQQPLRLLDPAVGIPRLAKTGDIGTVAAGG
ncbi:MAG: hypothetical protein LJE69_09345, partial [Thiohalocapsa sp.]|uniref:hypothetical protein n=1 Tax=Thiohalocapsa sp. TaxID=2497641 RepID=UPI0025E43E14